MPIISNFPVRTFKQEEADEIYVKLSGESAMEGDLSLGGHKVTNLGVPVNPTDAVRQQDLEALSDEIDKVISGTTPITMPAATEVKAGVIKIGNGLVATTDGTTSVDMDETPTLNSDKLIQSGGVYEALQEKQDTITGTQGQVVGFNSAGEPVAQEGVTSFNERTGDITPQTGDYTAAMVGARPDTWTPSAADVGAVPTGRTVNGHALTQNITLDAEDVGARANTWIPSATDVGAIPVTQKGVNGGVAELDSTGRVPVAQLPSYVDEVQEYTNRAAFPDTGEDGKIYVAEDTNITYRWSGSDYVEISPSLALGETAQTAYRGDHGLTAYNHSQTTGNPHNTTAADVGAVPTSRTINGQPLTSNVELDAGDIDDVVQLSGGATITLAQALQIVGASTIEITEDDAVDEPNAFLISIPTTGWTDNEQTFTVTGIPADPTTYEVHLSQVGRTNVQAAMDCGLKIIDEAQNSLTLAVSSVPEAAFQTYAVIEEVRTS